VLNNFLLEKIINTFGLFQNQRDSASDRKIFITLADQCLDEVGLFLIEHLEKEKGKALIQELKKAASEKRKVEILTKYLQTIPFWEIKINSRLESFIDGLAVKAFINAKKRRWKEKAS